MARGDRDWFVMADDFDVEAEFRQAIAEELAGLENIGYRTGGAYIATPIRVARDAQRPGITGLPDKEYVTIGWAFQQAFAPAARPAERVDVAPETVAEPVAT